MSSDAKAVIEELTLLPRLEQLAVYEAIARKVTPANYGPLSDAELTAIASESFAFLSYSELKTVSEASVFMT